MQQLRPYQSRALDDLRTAIRRGARAPLLVAPTGSGKTTISSALIHSAVAKGSRIIFLAHRRELVSQCSARLDEHGVEHGVILAGHPRYLPLAPVQVCSIQTLVRRRRPKAEIIFIDECHRAVAKTYRTILDEYPKAVTIGLTATPQRADGRGLGEVFDAIVSTPGPAELTAMGFLVPARVFAPSHPDLSGVHIRRGEYDQKEAAAAVDKPKLTGDIVQHWKDIAAGRRTLVFAASVEHSRHIRYRFQDAGVRAAHVDGNSHVTYRDAVFSELATGSLRVLCNVDVATEGLDIPAVSCVVDASPTISLVKALQRWGRILRPSPGKTDAIILDHANNTQTHGFVTQDREWSLEGTERRRNKKKDEDEAPSVTICTECYRAYPSTATQCPECGHGRPIKVRKVEEQAGQLVEVEASAYTIRKLSRHPRIAELQREAQAKGYKPGWVWHQAQKEGLRLGR